MRAGLVEEDQVRGVESIGLLGPPGRAGDLVALGGDEVLLLSRSSSFCSARHIVAGLTRAPVAAAQASQCSGNVASGVTPTWAMSWACWSGRIRGGRPGRGRGATAPVVARCRRQRFSVATPTASTSATSARGRPLSTNASARSRKSTEYVFMHPSSHAAQLIRKMV